MGIYICTDSESFSFWFAWYYNSGSQCLVWFVFLRVFRLVVSGPFCPAILLDIWVSPLQSVWSLEDWPLFQWQVF